MPTFVQKQNQPVKLVSSSLARPNNATLGPTVQTDVTAPEAEFIASRSSHLRYDFRRISIHPPVAGVIQAKSWRDKIDDEQKQQAKQGISPSAAGSMDRNGTNSGQALLQRQNLDGGQATHPPGTTGPVQDQDSHVTFLQFLNAGSGVTRRQLGSVGVGSVYGNGVELQFRIPPSVRQQYRNIRPTQWSGTEAIWVRRGLPLEGEWQSHRQSLGAGLDDPSSQNIVAQNNLIAYYDSPGPDILVGYLLHNAPSRLYSVQNFTGWIVGEPVKGGGTRQLCPVVAWYSVVDLVNMNWEHPENPPQWQRLGDSRAGQGWAATNTPPSI